MCGDGLFHSDFIVIDNASADDSVARIEAESPAIELHRNTENRGYALGVNQGLRLAQGLYITLLGSDTEVWGDTLTTFVEHLENNPAVGVVAPRLINPDQSIQRACMRFPDLRVALFDDTFIEKKWPESRISRHYNYKDWSHDNDAEVDQPPGTCLMVGREVVEQVGPMDGKLWLFFNDVDWCMRIRRAGWKVWYLQENTEVLHSRQTIPSQLLQQNQLRRWGFCPGAWLLVGTSSFRGRNDGKS